jgi:hypothetical protein
VVKRAFVIFASGLLGAAALVAGCNSILGIESHSLAADAGSGATNSGVRIGEDGSPSLVDDGSSATESGSGSTGTSSGSPSNGGADGGAIGGGDSGCTPCVLGAAKLGLCCVQ